MKKSVVLAVSNALILVMDHDSGSLPCSMGSALVSATSSCVAIGTKPASDGVSEVTLINEVECSATGLCVYEGSVETPSLEISVCDVTNVRLLSLPVEKSTTGVRVFVNDQYEPDRIVVVVR